MHYYLSPRARFLLLRPLKPRAIRWHSPLLARGTTYTQIFFGLGGGKLALMDGSGERTG